MLKSARQVLKNIFNASGKCFKIFLKHRQVFKNILSCFGKWQVLENIFYASASAQIRSASAQKMFKPSASVQKYFYASASAQIRSASARKYL